MDFLSDDARRDPYPAYAQARAASPLMQIPGTGLWAVFDHAGVRRVLSDHETFSSRHGADWLIFTDAPRHAKLRSLISKAFTPKSVTGMADRIRHLSRELLDRVAGRGQMDLAADFSVPLPTLVIAEMLGLPAADRARITRWNDVVLKMSYTIPGGRAGAGAAQAIDDFIATTGEMGEYLAVLLDCRRTQPTDDLLTRLLYAEVDGERLTHAEILGFLQLLLLAGSETTTNLVDNAILCFVAHPDQLDLLRGRMELLPSAIEEVLRYRSPLQWMYRIVRRDVEVHGQTIPAGRMVLAMIGSANHDAAAFAEPERFDVTRDPNPHVAFGLGAHFCMGAPLARLEGRIALEDLLGRFDRIELASDEPWEPRQGLHVHGPARLPIKWR